MSIDERLRTGLARNTDHLVPDVEHELGTTYGRARVRRVRRGGLALAAVAAVATAIVWYGDVPALRDAEPVGPDPEPRSATDLKGVTGALDPGTYSLAVWGETDRSLLPGPSSRCPRAGTATAATTIDSGDDVREPEQSGMVSVWRVDQVLTDPCRPGTATDPGDTVADLARALADQSGPNTRPRPVTLDGHRGLALEVTIPPVRDRDDLHRHPVLAVAHRRLVHPGHHRRRQPPAGSSTSTAPPSSSWSPPTPASRTSSPRTCSPSRETITFGPPRP